MRSRRVVFLLLVTSMLVQLSQAQVPAKAGSAAPAKAGSAAPKTAALKPEVHANLGQLMKGIIYPASNVIFAAQDENPADVKPAKDPSTSVNPLSSAYGQWQAVENAAMTLMEGANLLILPGRKCANGLPVPMQDADWAKFVQGLREAGMTAYKAAQSKNQDNILMAADTMTTACANCHDKYREKPNLADRCK